MRSRTFFTLLLLGFLAAVSPATANASEACQALKGFGQRLQCWAGQAQGSQAHPSGPVLVNLQGQLPLGDAGANANLQELRSAFAAGPLVVSVPGRKTTGPGGTMLLILATKRLVAPDSLISRLDPGTVSRLKESRLCGEGPPTICDQLAARDVAGRDLVAGGFAGDLTQAVDNVGAPVNPASTTKNGSGGNKDEPQAGSNDDGSSGLLLPIILGALAVLAIGFFVVRRNLTPHTAGGPAAGSQGHTHRQPEPPSTAKRAAATKVAHRSHPAAAPAGPRRTATLRTDLHPQGYVELDRCLLRAAWADPKVPPPAPGEPVDVVKGTGRDADILLAYPPRGGR